MNIICTILASIVLGMMPEVTYFTLFIMHFKNIKNKIFNLWLLIGLAYIVCMFIQRYKVVYYVLFIALVYLILKLLYKNQIQIIDVFVFSIATIYLSLVGFICSRFIFNNYVYYYLCLIISKILLFIPFIYKDKFHKLYKIYCGLWNRNYEKKQPIKSITLRNISLIILNCFIFLLNLGTIYVIHTFQ